MQAYDKKVWRTLGIALIGVAGMTLGSSILLRSDAGQWSFPALFVALLVLAAFALWACMPYWRQIDHMEREAQMVSWFWGGSFGAIAGLFGMAASRMNDDMAQGAALLAVIQVAGAVVFYIGWKLRHRGSPE